VLIDELSAETREPRTAQALVEAKAQLSSSEAQGAGEIVRVLGAALTSVMRIPGLRRAGQWASEQRLLGALAQVGRYLRRGNPEAGPPLDVRVRERVLAALPEDQPVVVVAHSLGSVVAFEALHEYPRSVRLLVTLGSPLATAAIVFDRVRPAPPTTPPTVQRWLNFWDRDDIVVARPRLERLVKANAAGVRAVSDRVDSDGFWVHTATKYLAQALVAGPIAEALSR
jgi:pimeloyl-ACP methyl ester carboxylesterase